jgi:hypothetical protein
MLKWMYKMMLMPKALQLVLLSEFPRKSLIIVFEVHWSSVKHGICIDLVKNLRSSIYGQFSNHVNKFENYFCQAYWRQAGINSKNIQINYLIVKIDSLL